MAGAILGPVVNQIQAGLAVMQSLAGLIITTHGLFIVLASLTAGVLIDRYGPRKPYILGLVVYALAGGAGLVVTSFPVLLVTRAALGVAVAFVYTGVTVLIYNLYSGRRKDRAMGLRAGANSVGASVWPLVGGILGTASWQVPFGVYLVGLPLGVAALLFVPEPAMESDPSESDGAGGSLRLLVDVITGTPLLLAVYLLYFLANVLLYSIVVYYPGILETYGLESSFQISLYLSVMGIAGGVSAALSIGSTGCSPTASWPGSRFSSGRSASPSFRSRIPRSWRSLRSCCSGSDRGWSSRRRCSGSKSWFRRAERGSSARTSPCSGTWDSSSRQWCSVRSRPGSASSRSSA